MLAPSCVRVRVLDGASMNVTAYGMWFKTTFTKENRGNNSVNTLAQKNKEEERDAESASQRTFIKLDKKSSEKNTKKEIQRKFFFGPTDEMRECTFIAYYFGFPKVSCKHSVSTSHQTEFINTVS